MFWEVMGCKVAIYFKLQYKGGVVTLCHPTSYSDSAVLSFQSLQTLLAGMRCWNDLFLVPNNLS